MIKYFLLFILLPFTFSFAQNVGSDGYYHSFQFGYGEKPGQKSYSGNTRLLNLSYGLVHENLQLQFTYFSSKAIKPNREFNETIDRLFIPQFGYDYKYLGFSLGLMFINNIKGDAPDMFALPVGSIRVGLISKYYFEINFLNEQSVPSLSLNLNYRFKYPLSYIKAGSVYLNNAWDYSSEIQVGFLRSFLFKLRGIYHLKNEHVYYFASFGFYHIF